MHSSLYLTALLVVPLIGALAITVIRRCAFAIGVGTSVVELVLALVVAVMYNPNVPGAHTTDFATRHVLAAPFGLAYDVSVDGISVLMVVLTSLVFFLALVGSRERRREATFVTWLLVLTASTMGSFLSTDLLEFFIFFELTLVPSYFIISQWGGRERARAAIKFFVYTFSGSAFLLAGLLYLGFVHQHQTGTALSFSYAALSSTTTSASTQVWLFCAFAAAFFVKAPVWPFHTWSPLAYAEAPTAGSIEFSALLAKLGSFGLIRFGVGLLPLAQVHVRPVVMTLAVIGIFYGSFVACTTKDLKRLIAYSSVAQMGFITLGIMSGSTIALVGAVLLMFNHGVITIGFFTLVGFIERRRGSYLISDLAGLQGPAPVMASLFTVVMLASIGLPGLSGFVSEFLILLGSFATHPWWAAVASGGVVAAAAYLLWAYQRVFHGEATGANREIADATHSERWVLVPVVALVVALGVFPQPVIHKISPTIQQFVAHVERASSAVLPTRSVK